MTNAAHTPEPWIISPTMRDKLLDAKRHLEKAQDEVDHGENDPIEVSILLDHAREAVYAALAAMESQP